MLARIPAALTVLTPLLPVPVPMLLPAPAVAVELIPSWPTLRQASRPPAKSVKVPRVQVSQPKEWTMPPHTSRAPKLVPL